MAVILPLYCYTINLNPKIEYLAKINLYIYIFLPSERKTTECNLAIS